VIVDGFFHSDPHPGNLLVDPQTGTLTFIDLGQVGVLDAPKRLDVIDLIVSLTQQDAGAIADVFLRLSRRLRPVDVAAYHRDMEDYIAQYLVYGTYGPNSTLSSFVSRLLALLQAHGLRLDRQLTLGLKALAQCEETLLALGTQFNVITFANEQLPDFAMEEITPQKVSELVKQQLTAAAKQIVRRVPNLPDATMMWLDQYLSGKFTVHLDTSDLGLDVDNFGVTIQRLTAGLVMTGMIVGTAIVASQFLVYEGANASWLPIFAVGVFVVMVLAGAGVIWNMLRGTTTRN
jgi:ubiquinone biosynthesis protein